MRKVNKRRAERFETAMRAYEKTETAAYAQEPLSSKVSDFLTDMMHWCKLRRIKFNDRLRVAQDDFYVETNSPR